MKISILLLLNATAVFAFVGAQGQVPRSQHMLKGHVPTVVLDGRAKPLASLSQSQGLAISIVLPLRNQAELTSLLNRLYDPSSPDYRHFLTVAEFTDRFGPSADDYDAVAHFFKNHGFTIMGSSANRLIVPVSGTVEQIEKTFSVGMKTYQHPSESRDFFSPDREPSLSLSVPVAHITGLNSFSKAIPMILKDAGPHALARPWAEGSGPGSAYLAADMRVAYYGDGLLTGSGQSVGLFEFDGYDINDVLATFDGKATAMAASSGADYDVAYTPTVGGPTYTVPIVNVLLDGISASNTSGSDAEEVLDIAQAIGMAPGLSQVRVYIGTSDSDILNAIASENIVKQVSISWTWVPDDLATDEEFFQECAAQGQTVFAASGDYGAFSPIYPSFYPAEDAWVTAVGGTTLITDGIGGAWSSELAWSRSGGGVSPDGVPVPTWQNPVGNSSNGASGTLRNVPDVAMEADFDNYVCDMGTCSVGWAGTSFAAPRWAGFMALVNEQELASGLQSIGFVNPALYGLGESSGYGTTFHDINNGNNEYVSGYSFTSVRGYDLVTGWGTPIGQSLIDNLAPVPSSGFSLTASPGTLSIAPASSGIITISVHKTGGFSGNVNLSVSGLPNGVTASFSPTSTSETSVMAFDTSTAAVSNSTLLTISGTSGGRTASTYLVLNVPSNAVVIDSPSIPTSSAVAEIFKSGTSIPIQATIFGNCQEFRVEWAPGIMPASGWTSLGINVGLRVSSPVVSETIATWDTSSISSAGYYTVRLSADYSSNTVASSTVVYIEPDLISENWPISVPSGPTIGSGVVLLNGNSGNPLLAWSSSGLTSSLFVSAPDGSSVMTVPLSGIADVYNLTVGSLDGSTGDELLTSAGDSIEVFRPDGTPYATFNGTVSDTNAPRFSYAQTVLDDLNHDSMPELIALEEDLISPGETGNLHVWLPSGQELNGNFPISIADQNVLLVNAFPRVLAGDIDGDGQDEIVAIEGTSPSTFTPLLFANDGLRRQWTAPTLTGGPQQILLADLDQNGKLELVMIVNDPSQQYRTLHVLQPDGTERPGWPVSLVPPTWASGSFDYAFAAVGDLNQNGSEQIVVSVGSTLYVFNGDGSSFSSAWPLTWPINSAEQISLTGPVILADVNGDGLPEILTTVGTAVSNPLTALNEPNIRTLGNVSTSAGGADRPIVTYSLGSVSTRPSGRGIGEVANSKAASQLQEQLVSLDRNGNILKTWDLLGANGQEPCWYGTITVGDFNRDGLTDIAVDYSTVSQQFGNSYYCMDRGVVTVFTTGTPFNPGANDWAMINHDPQNRAVLSRHAGTLVSVTSITDEPKAGRQASFTVVVSPTSPGPPIPNGLVNLLDNSKVIGSCQLLAGSCTISASFTEGTHQVLARYFGDANYAGSTSAFLSEVVDSSMSQTVIFLSVLPASLPMGAKVALTGSVAYSVLGTPTGTVTFAVGVTTLGTVPLNSATATLKVPVTPANGFVAGNNLITAIYSGDTDFAPSAGSISLTVEGQVVATPTFSVIPGSYPVAQTVSIADATPGAIIYFTTSGTTPTSSSTLYSGPITVSTSETLHAIAIANGYSTSAVATAAYTITPPAANPTFSPGAGTYTAVQTVAISDTTPSAVIYYTTNGTTPTTGSSVYSGPITVSSSETIEAIATATGYSTSAGASAVYTITPLAATPTFTVAPGTYPVAQTVSIADSTPRAVIYYTTNGTTPTTGSSVYSGPITVSSSETIEAIATATGYSTSAVATAAYTITPPAANPTFSPGAGTYTAVQTVAISDTTPSAVIYYTTNGTTPTTGSSVYGGPITVSSSETIEAIATATGYSTSAVATAAYTITPPASTPTFSPGPGIYTAVQTVAISDTTPSAIIYYTTNGTTPTTGSSVYSGPMTVSSSETIEAIATATGYSTSAVATAAYTITPPASTPTFSPGPGTYTAVQTVAISDTTPSAIIYYTTNGTTPTTGSSVYSGPITVSSSETVEAVATATGYSTSAGASAAYTITRPAATPTFSLAGGTYTSTQTVTISDSTPGAVIYYTIDGSTPTTGSTRYSAPITVSSSETIEAIATATGYSTSDVATAAYAINMPPAINLLSAATPTFSLAGGTYTSTQTVTISDSTPGAVIYYTIDGSTPTTGSTRYSAPITVSSSETIEAIATATGYSTSDVATAAYAINMPPAINLLSAATPTFSLAGGTYTSTQTVTISDSTPGAVIYYTIDGSTPTTGSTRYSAPITVSSSETIEAIATATGYSTSDVTTATYTISPSENSVPVISSLSPAFASAGSSAFTLTVSGVGFTTDSTVYWADSALRTQFVSSASLTAQVPASDIAGAGIAAITVQTPPPSGGTSQMFQFEVDSGSEISSAPTFNTVMARVNPGSPATYPVTLPSTASSVSATCLNLPAGALCGYSSATGALTITTSSSTPVGTYQITVVFTETLPSAASMLALLPLFLLPLSLVRCNRRSGQILFMARLGLVLAIAGAIVGCGGGSNSSGTTPPPPPSTHQVTSSGNVTLTVL